MPGNAFAIWLPKVTNTIELYPIGSPLCLCSAFALLPGPLGSQHAEQDEDLPGETALDHHPVLEELDGAVARLLPLQRAADASAHV